MNPDDGTAMKENELRPAARWAARLAGILGLLLATGGAAFAQKAPKTGGTPLDTLMNTRLWADVPEAKDFVRGTRRSPDELDFQPTRGSEHKRPKLRSPSELEALQSELERAAARNQAKAR